MAYQKQQGAKDIRHKPIKVLQSSEAEDGKTKSELMVEAWIIDGKETTPKIVRRDFFNTKEGNWKSGKAKGLTQSDYFILLERAFEIGPLMGVPAAKIAGMIGGQDGVDEAQPVKGKVPF